MRLRRFLSALMALMVLMMATPAFDIVALAKSMPYRIVVDITNQIFTIYDNDTGGIVRQGLCSTGAKEATPTGTFIMPEKVREAERTAWFHFNAYGGYARYASRIFKDIMFHSLLYTEPNVASLTMTSVQNLGKAVSHGCIRMRWQDAEFIAKQCLPGTSVKIYKSGKRDEELREILLQSSYSNENGQTYEQFLGVPQEEGVLGNFSKGDDVKDLQLRLRDLGIFTDEITGVYRGATVTAVREAQRMLGVEQTGVATLEFQSAIYAADAPAAMNVTLKEYMSGPAVRNLQENLAKLGIYEGGTDGVFDVDVVNAVKLFESAYGYETDGVATSLIQKAIYYEAGRLEAMFGAEGYTFERVDEDIYMGRVNCQVGIRMREKPSASSKALISLHPGDVVVAREHGSEWSLVRRGKLQGYVKNMYLDYYPQTVSSLRYTSNADGTSYTIGYTAEDYFNGADRPADVFQKYMQSGGSLDQYEGIGNYAVVNTASPDIALNLRESPNTESAVKAALSNGTQVEVLTRSDEWTMVEYNGQTGYLLNRYLQFASNAEEAASLTAIMEEGDIATELEHAQVACDTADKATVYGEDSADARVLGTLKNGTQVDVLQTVNGWSLISYKEHQGYMREDDLRFVVDGLET